MASTSGVADAATRSLLMSIRRTLIHCCSMYVNQRRVVLRGRSSPCSAARHHLRDPRHARVAGVHVAVVGVDCNPVHHAEVALAGMVAEPLVDELSVLVQMEYARGADLVRRRSIGVVGTLVRVSLGDVDVPVRREGEVERLPEEPL